MPHDGMQPERRSLSRRYDRYAIAFVGILGLVLTLVLDTAWEARDRQQLSARFRADSEHIAETIEQELQKRLAMVHAIRAFYDASVAVTRNEFMLITTDFRKQYDDVQALGWIPRIFHTARRQYEWDMRRNGTEGFQFKEVDRDGRLVRCPVRDAYYPVAYVEPHAGNEALLGFDLASDAGLSATLRRSCQLGRSAATYLPDLDDGAGLAGRFAVVVPVYDPAGVTFTVEGRNQSLRGFVFGEFRIDALVEEAVAASLHQGIEIELHDLASGGDPRLLHRVRASGALLDVSTGGAVETQQHALANHEVIHVLERPWRVDCIAMPAFYDRHMRAIWVILPIGLALTGLVMLLTRTQLNRTRQIEAVVARRTSDLAQANMILEAQQQQLKAQHEGLVEANRELDQARQVAEDSTRIKSEFLANMSHEIRTPMTAILGFTDVLMEMESPMPVPQERLVALSAIRRNGNHLLQIINDILDISKIEAGRLNVERVRCSPIDIVAEVQSLMQVRANAKHLGFQVKYEGGMPATIRTDPTRLKQILMNLVGNAIKFTEKGSVRLVVQCEPGDDNSLLRFDIIDTGLGMTAGQMEKLFNAFSQADASMTRRFGGTGLGLKISRQLARHLGGDVTVESTLGSGSVFHATVATGSLEGVTMLTDPTAATVMRPEITSDGQRTCGNLGGVRILFAEDGPDNQRLVRHILENAGAEITLAENGQLAMEAALSSQAAGHPFDVILMDMQMPVMDGYTATGVLRKRGYTAPIIALTAHAMASDRRKCLDAGCDDYTSKPIDRRRLIEVIRRWCQTIAEGKTPPTTLSSQVSS